MLMSWLSNIIWLEFTALPKDLVNNLVLTIGNNFLNMGILSPAEEVEGDVDHLLEVNISTDNLSLS